LQTAHLAVTAVDAGDFAVLYDVDPSLIGRASIAPGDRIVPGGAGTGLNCGTDDRKAGIGVIVKVRYMSLEGR
jgi:hypothetical protein